jgi:putative nucleotidyltransferase with HDIG domain
MTIPPGEHNNTNALIFKLVTAIINMHNPFEDGHEDRTSYIAANIAINMELPFAFVELVKDAAQLHDIGKIAIKENILNKQRLTRAEIIMIQGHTIHGEEIIARLNLHPDICEMIRHHHENWDGTGYPDKLKGEEIPIGARIIRIADTYESMTSNRSYRKSRPHKEVMQIMEKESGTCFDPDIFETFKETMTN